MHESLVRVFHRAARGAAAATLLALLASSAAAQIPDEFTNLQVFPADISKQELIGYMRSFAMGLGVRCQHCHVGDPGPSLKNMDFPSDEKEPKKKARLMIRMVQAINAEYIPKLGREKPVKVGCATCHHGLERPKSLAVVLGEVIEESGTDAAVARYHELRKEYYGSDSYDFQEWSLNGLAEQLVGQGKNPEALAILELNAELFAESAWVHFMMGQVHRKSGDEAAAIESYKKALELRPDDTRIKKILSELEDKFSS
jgi:tetratricopeptide (TPR) repeat protein